MIFFNEAMEKTASINALYNYAKSENITLFPTEDYNFWEAYELNYAKFDRFFYQKYRAFKVMLIYNRGASVAHMLEDWKSIIDAHFFLNAKRYNELYRVQVLADNAYDVVNNYDLNETITRTNTGTVEDARGARTDSIARGAGSTQTSYGAENVQTAYGARNSSNNTTLGAQTSDSTQSRSAFNASELVDVQGGSITNGSRQDSASLTEQSHTDTTTKAAKTDTTTEAARTDTASTGEQTNTRTDDLTENTTVRRYGNIGVQTPADVIGGHIDLWQAFKFYQMIFDEIAAEYLVIDVDFDFGSCPAITSGNPSNATLLSAIREVAQQIEEKTASDAESVGTIREDVADVHAAVTEIQTTLDDFIGG